MQGWDSQRAEQSGPQGAQTREMWKHWLTSRQLPLPALSLAVCSRHRSSRAGSRATQRSNKGS